MTSCPRLGRPRWDGTGRPILANFSATKGRVYSLWYSQPFMIYGFKKCSWTDFDFKHVMMFSDHAL